MAAPGSIAPTGVRHKPGYSAGRYRTPIVFAFEVEQRWVPGR
jgi:hypothetical protein